MLLRPQVATALGWSNGYTRGVFRVWKSRNAYCRAVLCYSVRINLDGSPSDEPVNDRDRELANAKLDQNAARNAAKRARELAKTTGEKAQDDQFAKAEQALDEIVASDQEFGLL